MALANNSAHGFAARRALVHYASGSVYSFIPKNGCSTMRVSLGVANGCIADPQKDWSWIHNNNATFAASLENLVTTPHTFVILRCPFARLASVFLDKIVSRRPEFWALRSVEREQVSSSDLTFRQFIKIIGKPSRLKLDQHWRPQVDFLVYEDYNAWYGLENFDRASADIEARTGMKIIDARPLTQHSAITVDDYGSAADVSVQTLERNKSEGALPRHADLYDDGLIKQVASIYKSDIALYKEKLGPDSLTFN